MKTSTRTYLKISGMIYGVILLLGFMVWLWATYLMGIVAAPVWYEAELTEALLMILGFTAVIALIQLLAWILYRMISKVR